MFIFIASLSILAITAVIWCVNKLLGWRICPICVGVAGTWLWMLLGKFIGYPVDTNVLSMLLGGSVVGVAYQLERHLSDNRSPLLWKTIVIPIGFIASYSLVNSRWPIFGITVVGLLAAAVIFLNPLKNKQKHTDRAVEDLEKKMKNCC